MVEIIFEIGKNFVITQEPEPLDILLNRAKVLIDEAISCGAKIVKFQVHFVDDEIYPEAKIIAPHFDHDRYEWVKRNTYPIEFWMEIMRYCDEVGVEFLATPMSRGSAIMLENLGIKRWKIGSGDILDFVMLDYIRRTGKPIIISSGMSTLQELKLAYDFLSEKVKDITILHCVSEYPCKLEHLNLKTIPFLKKQFPRAKIGFSDHSLEISTGLMAVQLGAVMVEKHFTLSRDVFGSDHKVSLLSHEFTQMVKEINSKKKIVIPEQAKGVETKFINSSEMDFRKVFRKGLYASCAIKKGQTFELEHFYALRPKGEGQPSENYPQMLGTKAKKNYLQYEAII